MTLNQELDKTILRIQRTQENAKEKENELTQKQQYNSDSVNQIFQKSSQKLLSLKESVSSKNINELNTETALQSTENVENIEEIVIHDKEINIDDKMTDIADNNDI